MADLQGGAAVYWSAGVLRADWWDSETCVAVCQWSVDVTAGLAHRQGGGVGHVVVCRGLQCVLVRS